MRDLNIIQLRGSLGKDAETKTTTGGKKVTALNIATTPRYLDKQTKKWKDGKTEWHRCYAWEKLAERAAKLKRGEAVQVEGTLTSREYEKDGITRQVWEVRITDLVRIAAFEKDSGEGEAAEGYPLDEEVPASFAA
jgi:single-strand DNA-binding protein